MVAREIGVSHHLVGTVGAEQRERDDHHRAHNLRALRHLTQRLYGHHACYHLKNDEFVRIRHADGGDDYGAKVEHECHSGVHEHTDDDGNHAEWDDEHMQQMMFNQGGRQRAEDGRQREQHDVCPQVGEVILSENEEEGVQHKQHDQNQCNLTNQGRKRTLG